MEAQIVSGESTGESAVFLTLDPTVSQGVLGIRWFCFAESRWVVCW